KTLKPLIFQYRQAPEFETKFDPSKSDKVFMEDVYLYGARRRCNAGFGLWQLAHCAANTGPIYANVAKMIAHMMTIKSDGGYVLDVKRACWLCRHNWKTQRVNC
ncbi:Mu-like prophage major head subunit gpT family protein, partial [Kingella kingae]|uniref:Mu-like prophage major head subunit gpT family protein n=1 Tax=Kingella kingae TaxID=504 RepID=UPI001E3AA167